MLIANRHIAVPSGLCNRCFETKVSHLEDLVARGADFQDALVIAACEGLPRHVIDQLWYETEMRLAHEIQVSRRRNERDVAVIW